MKHLISLTCLLLIGAMAVAADSEPISVTVKSGGTSCLLRGKAMDCATLAGPLKEILKSSPAGSVVVSHESCGEAAMTEMSGVADALKKTGFTRVTVVGFLSEPGKNCGAPAVQAGQLTDAPKGYEWYVFEEGNTACLRPSDWFVKTELKGDTAAMFFSKEDIDKEGEFKTGLTLNVLSRIQEKTGRLPSMYARDYLNALLAKYPDAKRFDDAPMNGVKGISAAYVDESRPLPVVIYTSLLADDQSDVLRIFILESPQTDWRETWALGERTLDCKIRR